MPLLVLAIIIILSFPFNYVESNNCCPKDKENWCNESCANCTSEDQRMLNEEQKLFHEFMSSLEEYDKFKTVWFSVKCTDANHIVPWQVEKFEDKPNVKDRLYEDKLEQLSNCNNCKKHSTVKDYYNCIMPVREKMKFEVQGIINTIRQSLRKQIAILRNECNSLQ